MEIVDVHLMLLTDPKLISKIEQRIIQNKINAEHAINDIFDEYIDLHKLQSCIKNEWHFARFHNPNREYYLRPEYQLS